MEWDLETNCTSGTAAAAADGEGCQTGTVIAAAADWRGCATSNNAFDTAAEIENVRVASTSAGRVSCIVAWASFVGSTSEPTEEGMEVAALMSAQHDISC